MHQHFKLANIKFLLLIFMEFTCNGQENNILFQLLCDQVLIQLLLLEYLLYHTMRLIFV